MPRAKTKRRAAPRGTSRSLGSPVRARDDKAKRKPRRRGKNPLLESIVGGAAAGTAVIAAQKLFQKFERKKNPTASEREQIARAVAVSIRALGFDAMAQEFLVEPAKRGRIIKALRRRVGKLLGPEKEKRWVHISSMAVPNPTVPEKHQIRIAKDTLKMSDAGARIMGGMTKEQAREILRKHGIRFKENSQSNRRERWVSVGSKRGLVGMVLEVQGGPGSHRHRLYIPGMGARWVSGRLYDVAAPADRGIADQFRGNPLPPGLPEQIGITAAEFSSRVRKALRAKGFTGKVRKGRGTAHSWIELSGSKSMGEFTPEEKQLLRSLGFTPGWNFANISPEKWRHWAEKLGVKLNPNGNGAAKGAGAGAAARGYADFHGRSPKEVLEMTETHLQSGDYYSLGDITGLWLRKVDGDPNGWGRATLEFDKKDHILLAASDDSNRQLYILGEDCCIPLAALRDLGLDTGKQFIPLGPVYGIGYLTEKKFDGFQTQEYAHRFGDVTGEVPSAFYDKKAHRILLVGGGYSIAPLDGELGASPGIVN